MVNETFSVPKRRSTNYTLSCQRRQVKNQRIIKKNQQKPTQTRRALLALKYVIISSWNVVVHRTKYFGKYHSAIGSKEGKLSLCSICEAASLPCELTLSSCTPQECRNQGHARLAWILRQNKARPLQKYSATLHPAILQDPLTDCASQQWGWTE